MLIKTAEFTAVTFDELFEKTKAVDWSKWIGKNDAFPVKGNPSFYFVKNIGLILFWWLTLRKSGGIIIYVVYRSYRDVAQFGRALRSGRRGRRFKSCHPDQNGKQIALLCGLFFYCQI